MGSTFVGRSTSIFDQVHQIGATGDKLCARARDLAQAIVEHQLRRLLES